METRIGRKKAGPGAAIAIVAALALVLAAGSVLAAGAAVDINSADTKVLESLPGVGPAIAQDIVKGRPYKTVDELAKVKGIGKAKLEKLRPLVTVGSQAAAQAPAAASAAAGKAASAAQAAKSAPAEAKKAATKAAAPAKGSVNLNTASKEQLEALPGIGPKKAQAIIEGRPYQKPEDIMKVKGIKQGIYNKIQEYITVQ